MAELVVDDIEVVAVDVNAHLDADVVAAVDVPGRGVADDVAVGGTREQGALPERVRKRRQAERGVEALARAHDALCVVALLREQLGDVVARVGLRGADEIGERAPVLRPHVAEEICAQRLIERHDRVAVVLVELRAHVAIELVVQRPHLGPQPVDFGGHCVGRHVVLR